MPTFTLLVPSKTTLLNDWKHPCYFILLWATKALLASSPAFAIDPSEYLLDALKQEKNDPTAAEELLLKIESRDPDFKQSVEELIKIYYRKSEWPSFFAYAQYYRKRYSPKERNQTQLLELLALLRHCQNEILFQLVTAYKMEIPKYTEQLDQMMALSRTRFRSKQAAPGDLKSLESHLGGVSLWPLAASEMTRVDPRKLKVRVENLCTH
jgi:hypothetical protein